MRLSIPMPKFFQKISGQEDLVRTGWLRVKFFRHKISVGEKNFGSVSRPEALTFKVEYQVKFVIEVLPFKFVKQFRVAFYLLQHPTIETLTASERFYNRQNPFLFHSHIFKFYNLFSRSQQEIGNNTPSTPTAMPSRPYTNA